MSLNQRKYLSYREAWRRINEATACGFYFEAVTLCESIISDRLLSFVRGVNPSSKMKPHSKFSQLIAEWRKLAGPTLTYKGADLGTQVDSWREERNIVVHGLVKSEPGAPTDEVESFLARARTAAESGAHLARSVSVWHKKQLSIAKHG